MYPGATLFQCVGFNMVYKAFRGIQHTGSVFSLHEVDEMQCFAQHTYHVASDEGVAL